MAGLTPHILRDAVFALPGGYPFFLRDLPYASLVAASRFYFWFLRGYAFSLSACRRLSPIFSGIVAGLVDVVFLLVFVSQKPKLTAIFGS